MRGDPRLLIEQWCCRQTVRVQSLRFRRIKLTEMLPLLAELCIGLSKLSSSVIVMPRYLLLSTTSCIRVHAAGSLYLEYRYV